VVAAAVEALGGLDALVYAAGTGVFKALSDTDGSDWRQVLDTNLVGATLIMRAAAPHIGAVRGKAVFFTSISIDDAPPRSNFANYVVSKVAMEALVRAWQGEHHAIGFTTVAMGDTLTEYGTGVPADVLGPIVERWVGEGYMYGSLMDATTVAAHVIHALACPDTIRRVAITPAYAPEGQEAAELYDRPS
jgi:NAD(P)-dependent dehydrogenase (short-subunit alcohol dehydrogenase family)